MPASDVKLYEDHVDIEGACQFVIKGWDLVLDAQDRRSNQTQFRRALVHDQDDRLTINYGGDYPRGVQINGSTEINGTTKINGSTQINGNASTYSTENLSVFRIQSAPSQGFGSSRIEFWSDPKEREWRPAYIQSTDAGNYTGGLIFVLNGAGSANKTGAIPVMHLRSETIGSSTNSCVDIQGNLTVTRGKLSALTVECSAMLIGQGVAALDVSTEIAKLQNQVRALKKALVDAKIPIPSSGGGGGKWDS